MTITLKLTKEGGVMGTTLYMSPHDIERQVIEDLLQYRRLYLERYKKEPTSPLDVESFVKELHGIEVVYTEFPKQGTEEVLGSFNPRTHSILIDAEACKHDRRVSFTVAHEAGHAVLHSFMFHNAKKIESTPAMERQADTYAAFLLAPTRDVVCLLENLGIVVDNAVLRPVDADALMPSFQEHFGLSRHAMEIRLRRMGISLLNARYVRD